MVASALSWRKRQRTVPLRRSAHVVSVRSATLAHCGRHARGADGAHHHTRKAVCSRASKARCSIGSAKKSARIEVARARASRLRYQVLKRITRDPERSRCCSMRCDAAPGCSKSTIATRGRTRSTACSIASSSCGRRGSWPEIATNVDMSDSAPGCALSRSTGSPCRALPGMGSCAMRGRCSEALRALRSPAWRALATRWGSWIVVTYRED